MNLQYSIYFQKLRYFQNKLKICVFLPFLLYSLLSCTHKMNPDTYKKNQIVFGNGGGFTNLVNEYRLLENKKLYHRTSAATEFSELGKQKADTVKLLFGKTKVLFADTTTFHSPGNRYYFIKYHTQNHIQTIVWGGSDANIPMEVLQKAKDLYKDLMNLVNLE